MKETKSATTSRAPAKAQGPQSPFAIQEALNMQKGVKKQAVDRQVAASVPTRAAQPQINRSTHGKKTRITVKYDVGFGSSLFVRGQGAANLSWNKGTPLKNVRADEWQWETEETFNNCEFKVLINDQEFEMGDNHVVKCGGNVQYSPSFPARG